MDERAFGFANMAFKTWAENLMETEYHPVLLAIADQIDYSRAVFTARHPRAFRNWTCMKVIRVLGVERYLELLHLTFGRGVR